MRSRGAENVLRLLKHDADEQPTPRTSATPGGLLVPATIRHIHVVLFGAHSRGVVCGGCR